MVYKRRVSLGANGKGQEMSGGCDCGNGLLCDS